MSAWTAAQAINKYQVRAKQCYRQQDRGMNVEHQHILSGVSKQLQGEGQKVHSAKPHYRRSSLGCNIPP